jgi:DNA-binding PadR family transcriptional regulator
MRLYPQTVAVLRALQENAASWSYGYDLSKATGIKSGTLYPLLARLYDEGWLETKWIEAREPGRPRRHLYRLTSSRLKEVRQICEESGVKKLSPRLAFES